VKLCHILTKKLGIFWNVIVYVNLTNFSFFMVKFCQIFYVKFFLRTLGKDSYQWLMEISKNLFYKQTCLHLHLYGLLFLCGFNCFVFFYQWVSFSLCALLTPSPMSNFFTQFFSIKFFFNFYFFVCFQAFCFKLWLQTYMNTTMNTTTKLVEATLDSTRITNEFLRTLFFPLRILFSKEWYSLFGCCNYHCCV
jgi:hypothetical protein